MSLEKLSDGGGESLDALVSILDEIRQARSRSRAELVARTGLSRGVVAQRVAELIELGLVVDDEIGPSTGGRPPRQMTFRADAGHVLVADLGATSIDVAVTDLDGRILGHRDEPSDIAAGPEACLQRVDELFAELTTATRDLPGRLWGIGIGIPGPVEFRSGRPVSPPIMPGWDDYPVRERFVAQYAAPVWVDNDVNLLALGEWRSGIAVGHDNVIVVKIGTGIGAGIISNGRIHRGAQGSAGDVGHIQVVEDNSVICRCGNVGCLEALAGGGAIGRDGLAAAVEGRSDRLRSSAGSARWSDGGGRREGGFVRRPGVGRAAPVGRPSGRAHACQRGEPVQPVARRRRRRRGPERRPAAGRHSRDGLPSLAAARHARAGSAALVAWALAGVMGASSMVMEQLFSREAMARLVTLGGPDQALEEAVAGSG